MKFTLLYNQEQSKAELIDRLILKPWAGYCLKNWLSENHQQMFAPEHKVKRLLDRCGTLLLRDVPPGERDTLTSYKEAAIGEREINLSAGPEAIADMAESGEIRLSELSADDRLRYQLLVDRLEAKVEKKEPAAKRPSTRYDRLEAIRRKHPGCDMDLCRVDVDGGFEHDGSRYRVDVTEGKYAPHKTRYGDQYDMDRIIVIVLRGGDKLFADQDGYLMDEAAVTVWER